MSDASEQPPRKLDSQRTLWRSSPKLLKLFAAVALVLGVALLASWSLISTQLFGRHTPSTSSPNTPVVNRAASTSPLSSKEAADLINEKIAQHPIVVRLPVGDIIAIDNSGNAIPVFQRLAEAEIIRLRVCHFPGAGGPGNQICLAELTDAAKQHVYNRETPFRVVELNAPEFSPKNRTFVHLVAATPYVEEIDELGAQTRAGRRVTYTARFQLNPVGKAIRLSSEAPDKLSAAAELRRMADGWQVSADGFEERQPKSD
jgi:hypothetical protein